MASQNKTRSAHHEILERVFNAVWREGFAQSRRWTHASRPAHAAAAVELPNGIEVLADIEATGALDTLRTAFPCYMRRSPNAPIEVLSEAEELLSLLPDRHGMRERVCRELRQSADNMELFLERRGVRLNELRELSLREGLLKAIFSQPAIQGVHPEEYLESWVFHGHSLHPGTKTRDGFSLEDLELYSPELGCQIGLNFVALKRTHMRESCQSEGSHTGYPRAWHVQLEEAARHESISLDEYEVLAVHPWQRQHILPKVFAREFRDGVIVPLNVSLPVRPLASLRTLAPVGEHDAPHLKLPLAIQATSVLRTIMPSTVSNGPRISRLLADILNQDAMLASILFPVPESCGIHYWEPGVADDDATCLEKARHLSMILRQRPGVKPGCWLIPNLLLTENSPLDEQPFVRELVEMSGDNPIRFFAEHARLSGRVMLRLLARFGVCIEAHAQNTLTYYKNGVPVAWAIRDFGALKVDLSRLRLAGHELSLHPVSHIEAHGIADLIFNAHHAWLQGGLAPLASTLSATYAIAESVLWREARRAIKAAWNEATAGIDMSWRTELERSLFSPSMHVKALTQMRLSGNPLKDEFCEVPNPLAGLIV